jgi:two-component system response regulator HydG
VRFNCAAITHELAEAELFGHVKGAFTGAHKSRRTASFARPTAGRSCSTRSGSSIRARRRSSCAPSKSGRGAAGGRGSTRSPVDVRILAATHRDLGDLVQKGLRSAKTSYYRLKVVQLRVPPLRERVGDVPVRSPATSSSATQVRFGVPTLEVTDEVIQRLAEQAWPGNVRELENMVESLVALSVDGHVDPMLLPGEGNPGVARELGLKEKVEAFERGVIVQALKEAHQNRTEAARRLGVSRATLHEKLTKYGIAGTES